MSENDKLLIEQAEKIHPSEWLEIEKLADKTRDPETREKLRRIMITKNHIDEGYRI